MRPSFAQQPDPALASPSRADGPLGGELDRLDLLDQIAAVLRPAALLRPGEARPPALPLSRVTVVLHPPELGAIHIAVESHGDGLAAQRLGAHFHATQPLVHAWLESNAPALRSHLSDLGLHFQDLSFSTTADHHSGGWPADHRDGFIPLPPPPPPAHPDSFLPSPGDLTSDPGSAASRTSAANWFA